MSGVRAGLAESDECQTEHTPDPSAHGWSIATCQHGVGAPCWPVALGAEPGRRVPSSLTRLKLLWCQTWVWRRGRRSGGAVAQARGADSCEPAGGELNHELA